MLGCVELETRLQKQKYITRVSFILCLISVVLTFASQALTADIIWSNFPEFALEAQWIMFILGFQVTDNTWTGVLRQTYFYLLLFWMNLIEIKCTHFL